ncbi:SdrD B-like domain-containing protein [Propionicimonas sp.]|uniref:SdrD B-like domain-containing protein n=1 Tax=Propionicimonas sp. TaxID=1955623 RepID=UPI0025E6A78C|nr:SdrD B-like domain-containing protein [Propionicimonas sp.]MBU3976648.1 hypothetical protein [Actinomycetota bacterium]MBU3986525.1 hypothetical protein [Actinomycetota bacterium]MBU4007323.1 hypothetical protein [Actinomycetota bacterium]MBU4065076.1 hypothetical protein [Actinomycetota bacterium]MBU4094589.1 hypothetical protein [Actinomycetota bacterium]
MKLFRRSGRWVSARVGVIAALSAALTFGALPAYAVPLALPGVNLLSGPVLPAAAGASAAAADEINGVVWLDVDADGTNDSTEPGMGSVTVRLLDSGGAEIATTTSDASGLYSFTGVTTGGPWRVEVQAPSGHTITEGGSDNEVTRFGAPNVGRSASIATAGTSVDAAVRPQWVVQLGTWGGGPFTGSAPFATDPDSNCPTSHAPGDDCSKTDDVVRAQDTVNFLWAVSASNPEGGLAGTLSDVVVVQTITPADGAIIKGGSLPASCNGTAPPTSRVTNNADGSITFVCNLGTWTDSGTAKLLQFDVDVQPSANGSTFTSTAVAYATNTEITGGNGTTDPQSTPNAVPSDKVTETFDISAAFKYDLNKTVLHSGGTTYFDPDGTGPEPSLRGRSVVFGFGISTPSMGSEPLAQPITFKEDLFFAGPGAASATPFPGGDIEHYVMSCGTNFYQSGALPNGALYISEDRSAINSGTCTYARAGAVTDQYAMTLSGINDSGSRFPTKFSNGSGDLSNGPYFVAAYSLQVFVPDRAMDTFDGVLGNSTGEGWIYNRVADFEPVSTSGQHNYAGAEEPGLCDSTHNTYASTTLDTGCRTMPNGTGSNDVAGPVNLKISPAGFGYDTTKYYWDTNTADAWPLTPSRLVNGQTSWHDGYGLKSPNQTMLSTFNLSAGGETAFRDGSICDVFDNTTQRLTDAHTVYAAAPAGTYAWLRISSYPAVTGGQASDWIFEYGSYDLSSDDPLYKGTQAGTIDSGLYPGTDSYSEATKRFEGTWTAQRDAASNCHTSAPNGGWHTNPADVPGGIDAVNAVRVRAANPAAAYGLTQSTSVLANNYAFVLTARDDFFGGAHAGEQVPDSTVLANFESGKLTRFDTGQVINLPSNYWPSPENSNIRGDRVTLVRAYLTLKKNTISVDGVGSGAAAIDRTGNANAGDTVVWQIQPAASGLDQNYLIETPKVVDVLPQYVYYDAACTASINGGTVPDLVEPNTPAAGQTRLTWFLPDQKVADTMPTLRVCTTTDALAPGGTSAVNTATVSAPELAAVGSDTHTVVLAQPGQIALQKYVDASLDPLDDDQQYRLVVRNLSSVVSMEPIKVIDVFPYNGDATNSAGVNRSPGSDYTGSLTLTGVPAVTYTDDPASGVVPGTMYYTADAPASVDQNWNTNTSRWCTYDGTTFTGASGTGACPASLAAVSAIKFEATASLPTNAAEGGIHDAMTVNLGLQATGNSNGALYANRFTGFTPTVRVSTAADADLQLLQSNRVQVQTYQFAVGDLLFIDVNDDGRYDSAVDELAPNGVGVELWSPGADGQIGGGDDTRIATTTTSSGTYLFTGLNQGQVYVRIPATEFAAGGKLAPYRASTHVGAADENDNVSQDGSADSGGVVSTIHTLSYHLSGDIPIGDEPFADNTHGLTLPPSLTDGFTNLTVDLALVPDPSIDLEKEVCTRADNSCDPDAAIGEGGWSVDGVDGDGPDSEVVTRPYKASALWRIVVTNTGGVILNNAVVTDSIEADCARDGQALAGLASMDPGDQVSWTCETSSVTGALRNQATVSAEPAGGGDSVTDSDTALVIAYRPVTHPAIDIIKYINGFDANTAPGVQVAPGSTMAVTMLVVNTGDVKLDPVVVTDDKIAAANISCPKTALAVGESMTCTATYPAPEVGVQHTNTATAVGTDPDGGTVSADDPAHAWAQAVVDDDDATDDDEVLAYTGAGAWVVYSMLALAGLAAGIVLVGAARRRRNS